MKVTGEKIRDYVVEVLNVPSNEITPDALLFSTGILDSIMLMELISFIEKEGGGKIPARAISLSNFDSINRMIAYLNKKT